MKKRGKLQLRSSQSVKYRLTTRNVAIFSLVAFFTGLTALVLNLSNSEQSFSATCTYTYTLDWSNPATFTVTCGTVNSAQWTVKNDSCNYYSPINLVGGLPGDPPRTTAIDVRVGQSGNLTNNDYASIIIYVNGSVYSNFVCRGDTLGGVFYVSQNITVPAAGNYQVRVAAKTDKTTEFWMIKNGEVTACVSTPPSPLPVTLTAFSGSVIDNKARLKWTTASEVNNDHFAIERSSDAGNYEEVGRLPGYGTTSVRHDYTFMDESTPSGISYYRLKQEDFDGTIKYYGPIAIRKNESDAHMTKPVVYPNPFTESFTYSYSAADNETTQLVLADQKGAVLESFPVEIKRGLNNIRIKPGIDLRPGIYLVGIQSGDQLTGFTRIVRK